eukprot:7415621-Pyramimonas_sp.AAC.1
MGDMAVADFLLSGGPNLLWKGFNKEPRPSSNTYEGPADHAAVQDTQTGTARAPGDPRHEAQRSRAPALERRIQADRP